MHRIIVLAAFEVALVLAIKEECFQLANLPATGCCKAMPLQIEENVPIDECLQELEKSPEPDPDNCELELCIGKKMGYLANDGAINKNAFEELIAETFKARPGLVENIKKNCINADVKEYGFEDFCELKKIDHCIYVQYAMSCPEFDIRGRCSDIKALAEKCVAE